MILSSNSIPPSDVLARDVPAGLEEEPLRELQDVRLVDDGDLLPAVREGVLEGVADDALGAGARDDRDRLRRRAPRIHVVLHARVQVLGVLAHHHQIHVLVARGHALERPHGAHVRVEVVELTQPDVDRAEPGAERTSVDPTRRLFEVTTGEEIATIDPAPALDFGTLACSAQLLGAGLRLLDDSVAYVKQRTQFGRPIGEFQAVKHLLADVRVALDFAAPLVHNAAVELDAEAGQVQHGVEQHRGVSDRQDEAIAIRPDRIVGIESHVLLPQRVNHRGHRHGRAR